MEPIAVKTTDEIQAGFICYVFGGGGRLVDPQFKKLVTIIVSCVYYTITRSSSQSSEMTITFHPCLSRTSGTYSLL